MTDKMREAFENWAKAECLDLDSIDGFYSDDDTHIAWGAWQAAQSVPVECCGCHVEGNEYMGQVQLGCCGNPEPAGIAASVPVVGEVVAWRIAKNGQWFPARNGKNLQAFIAGGYTVDALIVQPTHSISAAELERLRKCEDALSRVEWPKHWVDQYVEPKTLHKPVLVPLEVLIRTEFELTHSERGGDYDTKILGILRDIIAQADAAIAAEKKPINGSRPDAVIIDDPLAGGAGEYI